MTTGISGQKRESTLPMKSEDVYGITRSKTTTINSQNENTPCPLTEQYQNEFSGMQKMRKMTPNVKDEHTGSFSCMKEAHVKENGEEKMENMGVWPNGHAFWVFTFPKSQN